MLCILLGECFGQSNINIAQPINLQAVLQDTAAFLTWEAPVDTSASTDTIPPGLIGFRIYSNNILAGTVSYPELSYIHANPEIPVTFYKVTAVYNLSCFGFIDSICESEPSNLAFVISDTIYDVPFNESFNTGSFQTNNWDTTGSSNWRVSGYGFAIFFTDSVITNYSSSLTSSWINGNTIVDGILYIDFKYEVRTIQLTGTEFLSLDVFNGSEWIEKAKYNNAGPTHTMREMSVDLTNEAFGKPFKIRFRVQGEISENVVWYIDDIEIKPKCPAPEKLTITIPDPDTNPCIVRLEWFPPSSTYHPPDTWLYWCGDYYDYYGIGLTAGGSFHAAIRFTPDELGPYNGYKLTKILFRPFKNDATFTLKVWQGANASQLIISQSVPSYNAGQWNEVVLNTPVIVYDSTELWIGYEVSHQSGNDPAGLVGGSPVIGYGNMILLDGLNWESAEDYMGGNFAIKGFLTYDPVKQNLKESLAVSEYTITRNFWYIGSTTELNYTDDFSGESWPCYRIKAIYTDCQSSFSNEACITIQDNCNVNVKDLPINSMEVYPIPSNDVVNIYSKAELKKLRLIDILGREVFLYSHAGGILNYQLDVSSYKAGIYSLQVEGIDGTWNVKKIIISD